MAKTQTLTFKRTVKAPPSEVYRAFTNSTALRDWFSDGALSEPRKGGRVYFWWNDGYYASGEFTGMTAGKKVAFTWHGRGEPGASKVQVSLAGKDGGTTVRVSHVFGSGKVWAKTAKEIAHGWERALENLQSVLETGQDQRFTLRPMLGVSGGDEITPGSAAQEKLPVEVGVRLNGTVEGMGAQAAGLGKGDIIVGIGGRKVVGWSSLIAALQSHRAGDKVKVVYYRGGKKETATMELSRRPLPEVPDTAAGLADFVRKLYADFDAELAKCFAGVTEAEATYQPAPGEWSAKEVLSHLVQGERDNTSYLADAIQGTERLYDGNLDNSLLRTRVVADAFSTAQKMLEELTNLEAESMAMIAGLPPEFVARKGSFWRYAYGYTQAHTHNDEHLHQIKAAIEAARKK